jgi:hypothetical protein
VFPFVNGYFSQSFAPLFVQVFSGTLGCERWSAHVNMTVAEKRRGRRVPELMG